MGFNKLYKIAIVAALIFSPSVSHQFIFELPSVNLSSIYQHQKELVGSKRLPNSFRKNENAEQIVSHLLLEIVRESLPESYKANSQLITKTIIEEGNKYGMDPLLLASVISHESKFNPLAIGLVGEIGLMQIRPTTAKWLNDKFKIVKKLDLRNPEINIKVGAFFLNKLRKKFDQNGRHYLSAYNMGAAKLRQNLKRNVNPKEYVSNVMKHYVVYITRLEVAAKKSNELSEAEIVIRTAQLCNNGTSFLIAQN